MAARGSSGEAIELDAASLEAHDPAGGNAGRVLNSSIEARRAGVRPGFERAAAMDLLGGSDLERSIKPGDRRRGRRERGEDR